MRVVLHNPSASQMSAVEACVNKHAHVWLPEEYLDMDYSEDGENMYSLEVPVTDDEGVIRPKRT